WSKSIDRSLEMADEAAHKALDLDDSDPDACVLLGSIYRMRGESDRALELCQKAAALSPGTADMQAFLANSLLFAGRAQEAIRYIEKAMRLAPIYPHWYRLILGHCLSKLGETDKAIGVLNELVALAPESPMPRLSLVAVLTKGGLSKEAKTVAGDVLRLEPTISVKGFVQGYHHDPAEREKLLTNLLEAGLPE
ncbi:MAG: tetratricopeptide repeat protein, partial [Acidiferrobacterales bacterium]